MIRIAIVDDQSLVRAGLRQVFAGQADFVVAGEAITAHAALDLVRQAAVDVVVLDVAMAGGSGVDTLAAIHARAPALPVLVLSSFTEVRYAVTLLKMGASGYLNKCCSPEDIVSAIRTVAQGRKYISARVAEQLANAATAPDGQPAHAALSGRELQVFLHLAQGQTIGRLADSLCLSAKTVSTYRGRILDKLSLATNSDLTYYAMKNGLIQ